MDHPRGQQTTALSMSQIEPTTCSYKSSLIGLSHIHLFRYCLWLLSHTGQSWRVAKELCSQQSLKYLWSHSLQKNLADLYTKLRLESRKSKNKVILLKTGKENRTTWPQREQEEWHLCAWSTKTKLLRCLRTCFHFLMSLNTHMLLCSARSHGYFNFLFVLNLVSVCFFVAKNPHLIQRGPILWAQNEIKLRSNSNTVSIRQSSSGVSLIKQCNYSIFFLYYHIAMIVKDEYQY
jgi:hypothetical protein